MADNNTEKTVKKNGQSFTDKISLWWKGLKSEYSKIVWENKESVTNHKATAPVKSSPVTYVEKVSVSNEDTVTFEMYTRNTCPNCPSVKNYMSNLDIPGQAIDVDTEDGLAQAARKGVCATPTVIFYNEAGVETARCHNVKELEAVLNKVSVLA